jgi:IS30 family transposase
MSQLTSEQRYKLEALLQQNVRKIEIAAYLKIHISSIYRELNRNSDARNKVYKGDLAIRKCSLRHREKPKNKCFTAYLKTHISTMIEDDFSPEQIVGRAKDDGIKCVSHETIYAFIKKDRKTGGTLYLHLRTKGKSYRKRGESKDKRGKIKDQVNISERPKEVEDRKSFGDLEIDLVIGKDHKGALLTINDRSTGMLFMKKIESKDSEVVRQATIDLLKEHQPYLRTITSDNGKEFAKHKSISEELAIDYYFANPYCSWERGSNENLNGLVRQYFPKGSDFSLITPEKVIEVVNKLNNRPRKRYKFKTPNEVYLQKIKIN